LSGGRLVPGRQPRAARLFSLSRSEERALVRAARAGDRRSLRRLLQLVSGPVYRYGRGFCRDPHDAEEVLQEVLIALAQSLTRFRGDASVTTWAYKVARNACSRQRRRRAAEPESFLSLETAGNGGDGPMQVADTRSDPSRDAERRELGAALGEAIAGLPPSQRDVLVLRDVEGLKAAEVGKVLGINERAVKSRLHRARVNLRAALAPFAADTGKAAVKEKSCPDTARLMSRYLEDELSPAVCERLEAHVEGCLPCGEECAALRQALVT
jgi:RNA polymerase sigma-70 factor (ECF subfamily)